MASRISKIWNLLRRRMRVRGTPWTCCKTTSNFMIGPIKPRARDRQPSALFQFIGGWRWRIVGAALYAVIAAAPPAAATPPTPPAPAGEREGPPRVRPRAPPPAAATPPTPPAPAGARQPSPAATPPPPTQGAPDGDFIEFLGGDDVGDAAWWEFLKKVPPRGGNPPAPPPQDAKQ